MEFLRRFVQHVLPRGFVRIRQFGFWRINVGLRDSASLAGYFDASRQRITRPRPRQDGAVPGVARQ